MWKYCVLTPKRHYHAWIHVCWCIAFQNRSNGLSSKSVERFCVQRKKQEKNKLWLWLWGEVTPGAILTKCGVWGDMMDVITYAIFGDCRLGGVGVVRGVNFLLPLTWRVTNRVILASHIRPFDCEIVFRSTTPSAVRKYCWVFIFSKFSLKPRVNFCLQHHSINSDKIKKWNCDYFLFTVLISTLFRWLCVDGVYRDYFTGW